MQEETDRHSLQLNLWWGQEDVLVKRITWKTKAKTNEGILPSLLKGEKLERERCNKHASTRNIVVHSPQDIGETLNKLLILAN